LRLVVRPWAEVAVDGASVGTTPLRAMALSPGNHVVRMIHPDYRPLQRRVTIKAGETQMLQIDLSEEAFRIERR
jgi:hypothetical protein